MKNNKLFSFTLSIFVFLLISIASIVGCKDDDDIFIQPEERKSVNGILRITLEALIGSNKIKNSETSEMDTVNTPTFEGTLIGPTLRVKPGDTIDINLKNSLPPNPENQRMGPSAAFPHDPYTTNFHSHGLSVSPRGISDNVLRKMQPGTENPIEIEIPSDHACGTFWYHPHKHGAVSFQFFGGMFGVLIIDDDDCGLNQVPEIKAAKDIVMGLGVIRADETGTTPFVNMEAVAFSQNPGMGVTIPSLWQFFQDTNVYVTTNGVTNPTLNMRPGEVQRWRILNAASGLTIIPALEGHSLYVIAQDGLNTPEVVQLGVGEGYVLGAGNRVDVLIKAGEPGTYLLQGLDPSTPRSVATLSGIDPAPRPARIGMDFPVPTFPVPLATIVVSGDPKNMDLPSGPLPVPRGLPSIQEMLDAEIAEKRNVSFVLCSPGTSDILNEKLNDLCTYYLDRYDETYWGGEFLHANMMRDADDTGTPSSDPDIPFIFETEGLFTEGAPLFTGNEAMVAGTFEEWTILNRNFSDHPFHIHQNPFLVTHINGKELVVPEWRDTVLVPAADVGTEGNIADNAGSITFRTWFDPITFGNYVMHCHILSHEDTGMMQELELVPAP